MTEEAEHVPPEDNIDKMVEVARIIFHVATPLTMVVVDGRRTVRLPGVTQSPNGLPSPNDIDAKTISEPLTEALDGLVKDVGGKELGVVEVRIQAGGSIEIIAIVVATYLAVRQGVEVVETLQKVAEIGRGLVRAVMQTRQMQFTSVHGRVEINPTIAAIGRTRGFTFAGPIDTRVLLLLTILALFIAGAALAVVLTR
jgi:hypothetical protein